MKTAKWKSLSVLAIVAVLASYAAHTRTRIGQLEARIERSEAERHNASRQAVGYVFDKSFINYFGNHGVAEVERALKIPPQPNRIDPL